MTFAALMDRIVEMARKAAFSDAEIKELCEQKVKIMTYTEVSSCHSIDEVIGKHGAAIILYLTGEDYGHWVAVIRQSNEVIEFFDSYGLSPDHELFFVGDKKWKEKTAQDVPYLLSLMMISPYRIIFNQVQLQSKFKDVNTCGRWCALRVIFSRYGIDLKSFQQLFLKQKFAPDWYCTALTLFIR